MSIMHKVPAHVNIMDNHAVTARFRLKVFREKFNNLL